jgi:hemerythrin-like domain-containing protein
MPDVLDALRQEHGNTAALLRSLEWQIGEFATCSQPDYDVIAATLDYFLSFPELEHHPKEELIYARLQKRDPATAQAIGDLVRAHRELAARAREFAAGLRAVLGEAEVSREAFVRWARGFIDLQRHHITMEDESFFPAAERALTAQDWIELSGKLTTREDPLFGARVDERFERLRETILDWQAQDQAVAERSRAKSAVLP